MERSSPLAALQPSCIQPPWSRSISDLDHKFLYPSRNFNFKDLSMIKSSTDYFTLQPIRGSSPTALAADLSQNFHIDQTPQAATPRRSLFTNINTSGLHDTQQPLLTPPIPSSPMPGIEAMDCSPLPHKPAFSVKVQNNQLPTPDPTPLVDEGQFVAESEPACLQVTLPSPAQRRTSTSRPFLRKGFMNAVVPTRPRTAEAFNSPFVFGSMSRVSQAPTLESFAESPPSERKPAPLADTTASPLTRLNHVNSGSPIAGCGGRRPARRQGLGRRTQSLQYSNPYYNPIRSARQEKRCCTQGAISTTMPPETSHTLKLPHFRSEDDAYDALPRISQDTMLGVLEGRFANEVSNLIIVDCRFEYEYQGGHIQGAVNFNDKDMLRQELFHSASTSGGRTIVFHCEYSAHRAPLMAKAIREQDRNINQDRYPYLSYPEMYILDGGYSTFFDSHSGHCFPQSYKKMDAEEHAEDCERGMAKVKRRAKLSRAQTYAFGQHYGAAGVISTTTIGLGCFASVQAEPELPTDTTAVMDIDFEQAITLEDLLVKPSSRMPRRFDSY